MAGDGTTTKDHLSALLCQRDSFWPLTWSRTVSNDIKVPRLLTAKELAATLNVPLWRIYELVDVKKAPPSMRIGKTLRFPEDGVVQRIKEQTSEKADGRET
jgi:predicted DNA-binding transcriptional regulator AlpA